ncbi:4-hydroxy-3-methylbut-2-enyl diphosphate reductase [bacterium]|nr:4-hydroxy-3-methylbut-2-enyl diphosphate reductase [bacterium]
MQVVMARASGFCGDDGRFGVSGAIKLAQEAALSRPDEVYIVGDLVHNTHVTEWLRRDYGIKFVSKLSDVPDGKVLVIKAHGATPDFLAQAAAKKLTVVDATCPMVAGAQTLVRTLSAQGKKIVYVASDKKHDEARSVSAQAKGVKVVTLEQLDELEIKRPAETVVLTQTTLSMLETADKFARLQARYPDLEIRAHLCRATTDRQQAVLDLAADVDFLLVVGAPHSSNSRRLLEVAATTGLPARAVDEVSEIDERWFGAGIFRVGVIAGASTPEWITAAVVAKIESWKNA